MGRTKINRVLILTGLALTLLLAACVRSATTSDEEITALATEKSAATADAEIQMTLEALLGSATVEVAEATGTPTPVELDVVVEATATATVDGAQLTELAAVLTEAATTPEPEATEELEPSATPTANATSTACFAARYVYDESYPDGTRVDAGQAIQKTWRLQNVGTCDWVGGQYEIVFVTGDRMGGTTPLTINITVLAGNYANFSVNMRAPNEAGTYRGEWILRTKGGDVIGVGPNADLPIWIEIIVRG
jgi:hypothetical protein